MKTLIIHPSDPTTDVLKSIYKAFETVDVYNGRNTDELKQLVSNYDRFIVMGHGTPYGLLDVNKNYLFGYGMVTTFKNNDTNIYIWCKANDYVKDLNLKGFATGMIISELKEARWYDIKCTLGQIEESNELFVNSIKDNLSSDIQKMVFGVRKQYYSETNPIIKFNMKNIYGYI